MDTDQILPLLASGMLPRAVSGVTGAPIEKVRLLSLAHSTPSRVVRVAQAVTLIERGYTYRRAADELGLSVSSFQRLVQSAEGIRRAAEEARLELFALQAAMDKVRLTLAPREVES